MAGQVYTWQVSTPNIGTGPGRVSSAYNVDGKTPLTTVTQANPSGFVSVNTLSSDPVVSKTEYKIDQNGAITYKYTDPRGGVSYYNSIQDLIDDVKVTPSVGYQIRSAVGSNIAAEARQKKIGQAPIASLPPSAAQPGTGPAGNQVNTPVSATNEQLNEAGSSILDLDNETVKKVNSNLKSINVKYPRTMSGSQDRIKFTLKEIKGRTFGETDTNFTFGSKNIVDIGGSVILPIQPSISDSNGVDWGGSTLDPIQAYAARQSITLMQSENITARALEIFKEAPEVFKKDMGSYSTAVKLYLAQEAVGAQGLLSRATGAIVNPNLELLFNGPTLRSFNFTFRLSPRESGEAEDVKKIIYFFKAAMSVRKANSGVFLKAPYIFSVQYFSGNSPHNSLNKIKDCALLGCDVDYAPDGSYMTFNDANKTMTSYQLTLRFSELDPIYNTDYAGHPIGY